MICSCFSGWIGLLGMIYPGGPLEVLNQLLKPHNLIDMYAFDLFVLCFF